MTLERWLTPDEYAKERKVCIKTVYRLIKAGRLKAERVGSQWRIITFSQECSGQTRTNTD